LNWMAKEMDKKTIAIKIHSFVDVITNSSTELFMCNKKKSVKQVKKILKELVDHYNDGVKKGFSDSGETSIDNFLVYIYTQEKYNKSVENAKEKYHYNWDYEKEENIGKIIIEGTDDNIIPYELWDTIERIFKADREHLG